VTTDIEGDAAAKSTSRMSRRVGWGIALGVSALIVGYATWLVWTDAPLYQFVVRLYADKLFLKRTLREWGMLAPVIFIVVQASQVVVSPIPGEATGILGGYLFGQWLGLLYSTIGLTLGSVAAFGIGRWLGVHYVKNLVSTETWNRLGFIVEAEGAVLCFIVYLIPGLPKDIVCYLFGISPMPIWVFALVSGLGRIPGTWVLSAQGAHTAAGDYLQVILISAVAVGVALPLYYYRHRITAWLQGRRVPPSEAPDQAPNGRLDREKRGP
jgi:uncharacterized membrane protein YdjX (TVP38/TMEM64 family)